MFSFLVRSGAFAEERKNYSELSYISPYICRIGYWTLVKETAIFKLDEKLWYDKWRTENRTEKWISIITSDGIYVLYHFKFDINVILLLEILMISNEILHCWISTLLFHKTPLSSEWARSTLVILPPNKQIWNKELRYRSVPLSAFVYKCWSLLCK